jgi:hypothetical protein
MMGGEQGLKSNAGAETGRDMLHHKYTEVFLLERLLQVHLKSLSIFLPTVRCYVYVSAARSCHHIAAAKALGYHMSS